MIVTKLFPMLLGMLLCIPVYAAIDKHAADWRPIIGRHIPLDMRFRDDSNRGVKLEQYFGKRPVIMMLGYFKCQSLCPETYADTMQALRASRLEAGRDYELVIASIDPSDNATTAKLMKQRSGVDRHDNASAHFLTATMPTIDRLTHSVGFNYQYDKASQQFTHPAGLLVLTREGAIDQYLSGFNFSPIQLSDGILNANKDTPISVTERLRWLYYRLDLQSARYIPLIMRLAQGAGIMFVIALMLTIWRKQWKKDRRTALPVSSIGTDLRTT